VGAAKSGQIYSTETWPTETQVIAQNALIIPTRTILELLFSYNYSLQSEVMQAFRVSAITILQSVAMKAFIVSTITSLQSGAIPAFIVSAITSLQSGGAMQAFIVSALTSLQSEAMQAFTVSLRQQRIQ
jgi:hypothetical protein